MVSNQITSLNQVFVSEQSTKEKRSLSRNPRKLHRSIQNTNKLRPEIRNAASGNSGTSVSKEEREEEKKMKSRANASNIKIRDRRKLIEGGLGSSSHNMPSHNIPGGKGVRDS